MAERPAKSWLDGAWAALAVTLLVPLAFVAMPRVGLPTVDLDALDEAVGRVAGRLHLTPARASVGAFALGVMPFISASLLVELVAFVVPGWDRLRNGGPPGRAKLGRATAILGIALAGFQSFGVVRLIEALGADAAIGTISTPLVMVTLVAGTALLGLLADFATRRGLVSGFVTIYLATIVPTFIASAERLASDMHTQLPLVVTLAGAAASALATWLVLRPAKRAAVHVDVPLPASGLAPLVAAAALFAISDPLSIFGSLGRELNLALLTHRSALRVATLGGIFVLGTLFALLFYRPRRLAALWRRAGSRVAAADLEAEARARFRRSLFLSFLYLTVLFAIDALVTRFTGVGNTVVAAAVLTAVVLDAVEAWRARRRTDLVCVWPEQRPYAIAVAREALDAAGVSLVTSNERYRRLVPFSPFVSIDLWVPAGEAEQAKAILEAAIGPDAKHESKEPDVRAAPVAVDAAGRGWPLLAAGLVAAATLAFVERPQPPEPPRRPARPDAIQLLSVDDEATPIDVNAAAETLPVCMKLDFERAPIGPNKQAVRRYARCTIAQGETIADARRHLLAWAASLPVPPGERIIDGRYEEMDEEHDRLEVVGVRSYLVNPTPVIDGSDVRSVEVSFTGERGSETAVVIVALTPAGADKFFQFTSGSVGKRMAIVVDGSVISAPRIMGALSGGHFQITMGAGDRDEQLLQAERLAAAMMGRTSPAP